MQREGELEEHKLEGEMAGLDVRFMRARAQRAHGQPDAEPVARGLDTDEEDVWTRRRRRSIGAQH